MADIEYDDSNLQRMFAALSPQRRKAALKRGFKKEADRVRKVAVNNLRASGIKMSKGLDKGIRSVVFKNTPGFRVTIGTNAATAKSKGTGFHTNRRGLEKPVLLWAEGGTDERHTKPKRGADPKPGSRRRRGRRFDRKRAEHSTGSMKRYGFMAKTLSDVRDSVTNNIHGMVIDNVKMEAIKYGCY